MTTTNSNFIHAWSRGNAVRSTPQPKNLSCNGPELISYGTTIAIRHSSNTIIISADRFSPTTSRHLSEASSLFANVFESDKFKMNRTGIRPGLADCMAHCKRGMGELLTNLNNPDLRMPGLKMTLRQMNNVQDKMWRIVRISHGSIVLPNYAKFKVHKKIQDKCAQLILTDNHDTWSKPAKFIMEHAR